MKMRHTCQKSMNFQNNLDSQKERLNQIGFIYYYEYLKSN